MDAVEIMQDQLILKRWTPTCQARRDKTPPPDNIVINDMQDITLFTTSMQNRFLTQYIPMNLSIATCNIVLWNLKANIIDEHFEQS